MSTDESAQQVAARLGVTRQTIYNWVTRFQERGRVELIQRVADAPRAGRPRTALGVIEPLIDTVIHGDPRDLGYRSTVWTAPLLVEYLRKTHQVDVSCSSVRNAIAHLRIRWKRPRHNLALRARTWRQAKGG